MSLTPTYDDAELGALIREARGLGVTSFMLNEYTAGRAHADLFLQTSQKTSGADMVAMVHATGVGETLLEAVRQAVGKLRKTHQLAAPAVDKVIVDVPLPRALNPADKLPRISARR